MASSDIRRFHFYKKYIWLETDFDNFQTWLDATISMIGEGAFGASILSGLNVTPNGGLQVQIPAGIAVSATGRMMFNPATATANFVADGSLPVRHLLVMRPVDTDETDIPEPLNPVNMVPLEIQKGFSLVVISGTPNATPQYPSAQSEDVIIAGIKLTAGQATIAQADIDRTVIRVRRKKTLNIQQVASNYSAATGDEVIEASASGGGITVTLPAASAAPGQEFRVVKTDSSANAVTLSPNISGQSMTLDDQYQAVTVYSNGVSYYEL